MMALAMVIATMIEQDIAIVMLILMATTVTRTRQKPTTLAKVPRNMARMIRRSRVVPTWVMSIYYYV